MENSPERSPARESERRISLVLISLNVVTLIVAIVSFTSFQSVVTRKDAVVRDYNERLVIVADLKSLEEQFVAQGHSYLLTNDDLYLKRMRITQSRLQGVIKNLRSRVTSEQGQAHIDVIVDLEMDYRKKLHELIESRAPNTSTASIRSILNNELLPLRRKLAESIDDFRAYEDDLVERKQSESAKQANALSILLFLVLLFEVGLIMGVSWSLLSSIRRLHKAEQKSSELIGKLEAERETRKRFVSMLTHDLKTPLAAAKMGVELITRQPNNSSQVNLLAAKSIESLGRSENMVRDLLDANRIEAGKPLTIELEETDLNSLLRSTLEDLTLVYGDRFILKAPEQIKATVDKKSIRRIIENLASNAVKYGDIDHPVVVQLNGHHDRLEICVNNKGPALTQEELAHLFEQFHRTHAAQLSGKIGWGIGLTLVRGLTESMGGEIGVTSNEKEGTTFTVVFPSRLLIPLEPSHIHPKR